MQLSTILVTLVAFATSALAAPTDMTMSGEKRFVGGWCGLHVKVSSEDSMKGTVKVYDSKQFLLAQQDFSGSGTITGVITAQNGMGKDLSFNVQTSGDNIATFEYGSDYWGSGAAKSSNSRCSVGNWDLTNVFSGNENLNLDCGFSC